MADAPEQDGDVSDVSDVKRQLREALERKQQQANQQGHPDDAHFTAKGRDAGPGRAKFFRRKTG